MPATIKDIAKRLNISTSTVSYALNGGPRTVPEEVRKRVLDTARELDYRPNRVARSLVTRTSGAIGVIPPSLEIDVFLSPFVRLAWNAIVNAAEEFHRDLLLFTGHNRNSPEETGTELLDGRIDAVVFIAPRSDTRVIPFLADRQFPFASIASSSELPGARFTADNVQGVREAMEHLICLGHRRIAHVAGNAESADGRIRANAYRRIVVEHGLYDHPQYLQPATFTVGAGYEAGLRLMRLDPRPTAVFVGNDEMAYGLCQAVREAGLQVPRDLSVVGFDDCDLSFAFNPPLTTVRQPVAAMSAAALRAAVSLARDGGTVPSQAFATELVVRGSTAPIT